MVQTHGNSLKWRHGQTSGCQTQLSEVAPYFWCCWRLTNISCSASAQPGISGRYTNNDANGKVPCMQAANERILARLDMCQADEEANWHKHKDGQAHGEVARLKVLPAQLSLGPRLADSVGAVAPAGYASHQRRFVSGQPARQKAKTTCAVANTRERQVSEQGANPASCSLDAAVLDEHKWTAGCCAQTTVWAACRPL